MTEAAGSRRVALDVSRPIWERCFTVAPLVLVGTRDEDGSPDLAPKHMVSPMGWENYFGFVCTPSHSTYGNIRRTGVFTVSFPKPSQVLFAGLAASPRCDTGEKPVLDAFSTIPAEEVDGVLVEDAYLLLECEHYRTYDDFGVNSLITGRIVAARVDAAALRSSDRDDQELIHEAPLFAYLHPGRFASIDASNAFPFPADMKK